MKPDERPLAGAGVLVTRPEPEAGGLAEQVEAAGGRALVVPVMTLAPPSDPAPAVAALGSLRDGDWLLPVSPGAVRSLSRLLAEQGVSLPAVRFAAVGAGTARALEAAGWVPAVRPAQGEGAAALLATPAFAPAEGEQVLICRGEGGRRVLDEGLRARGVRFRAATLYRRQPDRAQAERLAHCLRQGDVDIVTLTSATAVDCLLDLTPAALHPRLLGLAVVAPSERVLQKADERGFQGPRLLAARAGDQAVVHAAGEWWQRHRNQT